MHWLRLWHDLPNDPKLRTIARKSGQPISAVMAVFVHMLVNASVSEVRGTLSSWEDEDIASALDLDTEQVTAIREAMQGRLLDGDVLTGWSKRQPLREDVGSDEEDGSGAMSAAERKRLQRQREREAKQADMSRDVTQCHDMSRDVTQCHDMSRDVTHGHAPDADAERDKDLKPRVLNDDKATVTTVGETNPLPSSFAQPDPLPSAATPPPLQARAIELTVMLRQRGAALQAADPHVQSWAATGVSDAQALTALDTAKQQRADKGDISPISSGYLNAILQSQTNQQAKARASPSRSPSTQMQDERLRIAREITEAAKHGRNREIDITGSAVVVDGQAVRTDGVDVRPALVGHVGRA